MPRRFHYLTPAQILVSTVTGVTLKEIEMALGIQPMLRIMPNTALEICESMTCMSFKNSTAKRHEDLIVVHVQENGENTGHSRGYDGRSNRGGCLWNCFCTRFMRAMSQGGIEIGFNSEMSQLITAQTVKGAARLIIETSNHPEKEIDKVTTPQGITISGLNEMEHQGLSSAVIRGLITSFNKLENLSSKSHK